MTFIDDLKKENNLKEGFNGELGYESTNNYLLDLYDMVGNLRFRSIEDFADLLMKSYINDHINTTKLIAHARDIRQGAGDKDFGRMGFLYILEHIDVKNIEKFINVVAEYGSYKDVVIILSASENIKGISEEKVRHFVQILDDTLDNDFCSERPSLLAKYMPTESSKNDISKTAYRTFMKYSSITPKAYRKRNTAIRKKLDIVETKLTEKDYESIDYSKVPSQAGFKYQDAFYRNDTENYCEYIKEVNSGEKKINAKTLAPYQIVEKIFSQNYVASHTDKVLWNNLEKPDNKGMKVLPVVDVSGSMYGLPMSVAISLGIVLAENNEGEFKNHFITFSESPKLQKLHGNNIEEKIRFLSRSEWGFNTNLEKVFNLVLNTAKKNNYSQEDIPESIIIFSDMNMDEANDGRRISFFDKMKDKYEEAGYKLPFLVFWNIGYGDVKPVTESTKNTIMISGFSQNLFNSVFNLDLDDLENYTPIKALMETLELDRYKVIEGLYQTAD